MGFDGKDICDGVRFNDDSGCNCPNTDGGENLVVCEVPFRLLIGVDCNETFLLGDGPFFSVCV